MLFKYDIFTKNIAKMFLIRLKYQILDKIFLLESFLKQIMLYKTNLCNNLMKNILF
jgi:hypothetical protein